MAFWVQKGAPLPPTPITPAPPWLPAFLAIPGLPTRCPLCQSTPLSPGNPAHPSVTGCPRDFFQGSRAPRHHTPSSRRTCDEVINRVLVEYGLPFQEVVSL